jgi:hypothetical protein
VNSCDLVTVCEADGRSRLGCIYTLRLVDAEQEDGISNLLVLGEPGLEELHCIS